jgi:hypothetical protein
MLTSGVVFAIMYKIVTLLPVLLLDFYRIMAYQGHSIVLVNKLNMFFLEKLKMKL